MKIALARERLRDPDILILDEALSSLDIPTRRKVFKAIRKWRQGQTTIVITHDIAEIEQDDFAFVMADGKVVQRGFRRDLETSTGEFQTLAASFGIEGPKIGLNDFDWIQTKPPVIPELQTEFWTKSYSSLRIDPPWRTLIPPSPRSARSGFFRDKSSILSPIDKTLLGRRDSCLDIPSTSIIEINSPDIFSYFSEDSNAPMLPKFPGKDKAVSISSILCTVWPALGIGLKLRLVVGLIAAFLYSAGTPAFSYALARLLESLLDHRIPSSRSKNWSLVIIGIAVFDAFNCFVMIYLLETSGQAWVDHHRNKGLANVLDQPMTWFHQGENTEAEIVAILEKHAEEMQSLVARFAGYGFVGLSMTAIGIAWALVSNWNLALAGCCIAPAMYGISRGMGWASDKYESMCNDASQISGSILHETVSNIETVQNYGVERYFRRKYFEATHSALRTGLWRSAHAGFWVGLSDSAILFATGQFDEFTSIQEAIY